MCFLRTRPSLQGPPPGLTHGSDPKSGGEGRLLLISTLAGVELPPRKAERRPVRGQLRPRPLAIWPRPGLLVSPRP